MGTPDPNQTSPSREELQEQFATWEKDVVKILARSSRKEPSELPTDAWRKLIHTTPEGLEVNPLYTRLDEGDEQAAPGQFPFVRGGSQAGRPDSGWFVAEQFSAGDDAKAANETLLGALEQGTSALWLDASAGDIPALLKGVYLELTPLIVDSAAISATTEAVYQAVESAATDGKLTGERSDVRINVAAAPFTDALAESEDGISPDTAAALAEIAAGRPESVRSLLADGSVAHELGATDAQELGIAVAAAVENVRAAVAGGLSVEDAVSQVWFRFAATPDQFATIAKMRAARALWARVAQVLECPTAGDAPQHAVTSLAASTRRDPYVNMLRTTVAAFAAGIGGATYVTVRPFDAALGELAGTSRSFVRRMARNTQLLLLEESHLGHVIDPAGGSWYVEAYTSELAEAGWSYFQKLEAAGGLGSALDTVREDLAAARADRDQVVAKRKHPLTGLSEFPNLAEKPLPAEQRDIDRYSYGEAFEKLRDRSDAFLESTGQRPTVALAGLGLPAERSARTTFVVNLLAAGGIDVVDLEVSQTSEYQGAFEGHLASDVNKAQQSPVALLVGTDKRYAENGGEAVAALRSAGAEKVLVAGAAKAFGEASGDQAADEFLAMGIDAVAALTGLAAQLGVK